MSALSKETSARFAASGRAEKAAAMVVVVEQVAAALGYDGLGDAEEIASRLRLLNDTDWLNMQRLAGFTRKEPPSQATRDLVLDTFYRRIDIAGETEEP